VRRICFTLQVRPDRLEEYRRRHAQVWPDMLAALRDTGWHDYSLFLRGDGLLVGYLAAYAAGALASGMISGKEGEKFTAGKLGEFTVGKNGEVLLGEPFTFNASNIDQFNF